MSDVYYKTSDLDAIAFPSGIGTPFITSTAVGGINNPTSTKQNIDAASGLVVLASSAETATYWHNTLSFGSSSSTSSSNETQSDPSAGLPIGGLIP
jgi:hypothetical protein